MERQSCNDEEWVMDRQLAKAVVAAFCTDEPEIARRQLEGFRERDWTRTRGWLHTSGMALYFLDRATRLGIEDVMPDALVHELSMNLAENRGRMAGLFEEFSRLNADFQRAEISYVNLKGFSLAPEAYADPAFRYQLDLDFLVARSDLERCAQILARYGYRPRGTASPAWEFQRGIPAKVPLRDLHCGRPEWVVELHAPSEDEPARGGGRLSRMKLQVWNGFEFPALSDVDKLLRQAVHIFEHLQGEWTRLAWLLEYGTAVRAHRNDDVLWGEVVAAVAGAPEIRTGVALASLITERVFGATFPREFREQTIDLLRPEVELWVERYRDELVLSQHPGSKLYLLLGDVLEGRRGEWQAKRRKKLLPLHAPVRIKPKAHGGLRAALMLEFGHLHFAVRRLWFHMVQGARYKLESARWRRFVVRAGL